MEHNVREIPAMLINTIYHIDIRTGGEGFKEFKVTTGEFVNIQQRMNREDLYDQMIFEWKSKKDHKGRLADFWEEGVQSGQHMQRSIDHCKDLAFTVIDMGKQQRGFGRV